MIWYDYKVINFNNYATKYVELSITYQGLGFISRFKRNDFLLFLRQPKSNSNG